MFPGLSIDVASIEEDNLRQMSSQSTRDPYLSIGGSVYLAQGYVLRRHGMDVPDTELGTDEGISLLNMSPTDIEILPIQERLGKGSSGSVKKALHRPTRREIALKEIPLTSEHHLSEVAKELNALRKVAQDAAQWIDVDREEADSGVDVGVQISRTRRLETLGARYLIHMIGAFVRDASANLAMEYMDGSLLALCAPPVVPEPVLACITKMILLGLDYLHRTLHIIHRDIKPSNLLFSRKSGRIKIADFGVSSRADDAHTVGLSFVGTVSYMSPERLNGDDYATAVDVWSLGVTLTELITGVHPFSYLWRRPADTTTNILERSTAEEKFWALLSYFKSKQTLDALIQLPESVNASPELQDFVRVCTMRDAAQRMAAHELLRHPWIVQHTRSSSAEPPDLDHMESYVDDRKERHIILQYLNEREAVGTQNQSGGSSMKVERTEVTGTHPALTPTMPKKSDALCSAIDDILEGI